MGFENVIIAALGLQDVVLEKVEMSKSDLRLNVYVRQDRYKCRCSTCGCQIGHIHEWKEREIQGPPVGAFLYVTIHLRRLRGYCTGCADEIRSAKVPFTHPKVENLSLAFCEWAGRLMEEMPCDAVARFFGVNSKTMWRLDQVRMAMMKPLMRLPSDIDLEKMSADEVHYRTMPKERSFLKPEIKFITNLVCYKERKVLANASGRDSRALEECLRSLSPAQRLSIKFFSVDLHDPFMTVIRRRCPNAVICADRFHLAELCNTAFDEVRKLEFRRADEAGDNFQMGMLAPHRRFVLVEREKKLTKKDLKMLDRLKELNKNILNAMILVEHFHRVLDKYDVLEFRKSLILWYRLVRESQLRPFLKFAKTLRKYRAHVENYIKSKLTTAVSEGLNNKIKVLKRMGYGYTNEESYKSKILQRCGYLNSRYINTTGWFWQLPTDLAQNPPAY